MILTRNDFESAFLKMGLKDRDVIVHSSLKSFKTKVEGGTQSIISALIAISKNTLMPAFSFDFLDVTSPGKDEEILQNGIDYKVYDNPEYYPSKDIFDPVKLRDTLCIDEDMGIIAKNFLKAPKTVRSNHPFQSIAVNGEDAEFYIKSHPLDDLLRPLKKLYEKRGFVLLLGTDLDSCTAFHLAEEFAGRRSFIRWVKYAGNIVKRVALNSCSDGFVNYEQYLESICKRYKIGNCQVKLYPIKELVDLGADIIKKFPNLTLCEEDNGKGCSLCKDNVKGGPITT